MSYVNTPQRGSRTTELLTPHQRHIGRIVAGGMVVFLVVMAIALDIREKRQAAAPTKPAIVILIATPSPRPIEPTATPFPTPAPQIVFATVIVEQPVYIEVPAAVEEAPPTMAPEPTPTLLPMLMGERLDEYFKRVNITPVRVQP